MQSLRAVLWNSCPEKKLEHILENIRGGVLFEGLMVMFFTKHLLERTVTLKISQKNV